MARADLNAKLNLDSTAFERGVQRSQKAVGRMQKAVVGAANALAKMGLASASAAVLLLSRNAIQLGSYLSDVAISTGFATEQFQVFRGALIDAGGKSESMEKSILTMQKAVVQGAEGMTTYTRAFERLGLNVDDLRKMKPEDQFQAIGKAIAGAEDQQGALTAAIEIFGQRNAPRLIEVFKRLDSEGYGKMAKDIEAAYGIMTAETQKALDRAADQIERFKSKATIKVGELIAGEAGGAALKELGFRLMGVAARFGGTILDGLASIGQIVKAGIGGSFDWVASKFGNSLADMMDDMQRRLILAGQEIAKRTQSESEFAKTVEENTEKLLELIMRKRERAEKDSQKSWSDFFEDSIPEPTDYAGELSGFWKGLADEQRKILNESRNDSDPGLASPTSTNNRSDNEKADTVATKKAVTESTTDGGRTQRGIQTGKITTGQIGGFQSRFGAPQTMEERERAAGLFLAGNDPMSGRRADGAKGTAADKGTEEAGKQGSDQDDPLKNIEQILTKLDGALSGGN